MQMPPTQTEGLSIEKIENIRQIPKNKKNEVTVSHTKKLENILNVPRIRDATSKCTQDTHDVI